jgi:hypothetical protein
VRVSGSLSVTETGLDVFFATGRKIATGILAATETGEDQASFIGLLGPTPDVPSGGSSVIYGKKPIKLPKPPRYFLPDQQIIFDNDEDALVVLEMI